MGRKPRGGRVVRPLVQFGHQLLAGKAERGAAGGVEAVKFFVGGAPDDREEVAADAVAGGFHEAERGVGRDGRIHGRAAGFQHVEGDLRGQRVRGGGHAVLGDDLGAGGEGATVDAVGLGRERKTGNGGKQAENRNQAAGSDHAGRLASGLRRVNWRPGAGALT
jgi:hypothetical protein